MDVSNSTGQDTSYRVLGGGGQAPKPSKGGRGKEKGKDKPKGGEEPQPLHIGTLQPHTYVTLDLPDAVSPCRVQFHREGKLIAEKELEAKDGDYGAVLVALVPDGKGTPKPFVCRRKA